MDLYSWRHIVGYVSQDCFLFYTTVRENILIGKPGAGDQEVITAAKMASIHEFIESLPAKYDTVIGDSGVGLSGGQRQRIAIARALVRNPEILIFDEATSSLDAESEMYVLKTIKNFLQKKTVIIITHRLTSLWIADQIHVLDKGKVVESGKYEQLIENKGLFWKLERLFRKEAEQSAITSKDETAAIKQ